MRKNPSRASGNCKVANGKERGGLFKKREEIISIQKTHGIFYLGFFTEDFLLETVEIFNKVTAIRPLPSRIIFRCTGN